MNKNSFKKIIYRTCLICGKKIRIIHYKDGHYRNAYYYGILEESIKGTGENVKTGEFKLGKFKADVVKWTGKVKKHEYWECEKCYSEGSFECTLENKIEKLYGERCKDFESSCIVCQVWDMYDTIIKDNRKEL